MRRGRSWRAPRRSPLGHLQRKSYAEIAGRIARLRAADLTRLSEQQIDQRLGPLMDGHLAKTATLTINRVFRARKVPPGADFQNVSELWYPPAELVQPGRFNRAGEQVFYAASTMNAALWEIRPSEGDRVAVAICATKAPTCDFRCAHLGLYRYSGHPPTIGDTPDVRSDARFLNTREVAGIDQKWRRIDAFFADLATADEREWPGLYAATVRLSEMMLRIPEAEGLAYPSVAADLAAFNLRLAPAVADAELSVTEVFEFQLVKHWEHLEGRPPSKPGYGLMRPIRTSEAIDAAGNIKWPAGAVADPAADSPQ